MDNLSEEEIQLATPDKDCDALLEELRTSTDDEARVLNSSLVNNSLFNDVQKTKKRARESDALEEILS